VDDEQRRRTNEYKTAYEAEVLKRSLFENPVTAMMRAGVDPSLLTGLSGLSNTTMAQALQVVGKLSLADVDPSFLENPVTAAARAMADASRAEAAVVELVRRDLASADGAGRELAPGGAPEPAIVPSNNNDTPKTTQEKAATRRRAVILPLLKKKRWTPYRWEKEATVSSKVGTRYLAGKTFPSVDSRQKLSSALDIEDLPR
jgi:hypothetical protein